PDQQPDNLLGRLTKYIPAPLLTLYAAAYGIIASLTLTPVTARWVVTAMAAMFLVAVTARIWKSAPSTVVRDAHLTVTPIAFLVWAYTVSGSLLGSWFVGWVAFLGQVAVALLAWYMEPTEVTNGGNAGKHEGGAA